MSGDRPPATPGGPDPGAHPGSHPAHDALRDLVARKPSWSRGLPGLASGEAGVRDAAVLVLLGVLDAVPARAADATGRAPVDATGRAPVSGTVGADLDVLLMRRPDAAGHHPGQVSFPGGGAEPGDDSPAATALREAVEETGLDPTGVELLGTLPALPVAVSRNLVTPVVAWWTRPSQVAAADPAEAVAVFRAPVADLVHPDNRRTAVIERSGRRYAGPAFLVSGHLVWGFTAFVLDRLLDELGWAVPWDAERTVDPLP